MGDGGAVDLVSGRKSINFSQTPRVDPSYGRYIEHSANGYYLGNYSVPTSVSIVGLQYFAAGENHDHALFSKKSSSGVDQDLLLWIDYQTTFTTRAYAGSAVNAGVAISADTWHLWGANIISGASTQFFLNGAKCGTQQGSAGSWDTNPCEVYIGANSDDSKGSTGGIAFVAAWRGLLSDSAHFDVYQNFTKVFVPD